MGLQSSSPIDVSPSFSFIPYFERFIVTLPNYLIRSIVVVFSALKESPIAMTEM
jgi:hypothetical protein